MFSFRASLAAAAGALALASAAAGQGDLIAVADLGDADAFTMGVIGRGEGALPPSLWTGSGAEQLGDLLAAAPSGEHSHAAGALARRVLLSGGRAPADAGQTAALAAARLDALLRLGAAAQVEAIASGSSNALASRGVGRTAAQARLALDDAAGACRLTDDAGAEGGGAFWTRLRAACFALADEPAAAQVTLDLARDADVAGVDDDFDAWIAHAAGDGRGAGAPRDAIELALALKGGAEITPDVVNAAPLAAVAGLARNETIDVARRRTAAWRAALAGVVPADELAELLSSGGEDDTRSTADFLEAAGEAEDLDQLSLFRRAALRSESAVELADAVAGALETAEGARAFALVAEVFLGELSLMERTAETVSYAHVYAEAAAAIGESGLARRWLETRTTPLGGPASLSSLPIEETVEPSIIPLEAAALNALITASDSLSDERALADGARWRLETTLDQPEPEQTAARRDVLILLALGADTTPVLRAAATRAAAEAGDIGQEARGALFAMEAAAQAGALGEAALNAARALAADPDNPGVSAAVITRLRALGLGEDARAIAVEAMLAGRREP